MSDDAVVRHPGMRARPSADTDEDTLMIIDQIEDQYRLFIIQPPLTVRPRWVDDAFYVTDERLNLQVRGETLAAVRQALDQMIPQVWDRYTDPALTPADDGFKIGKALRRRIRVENRQA